MSDYKVLSVKDNKALIKGPFNQYFIVPASKTDDIEYLEFAWGNGEHINVDKILTKLFQR